MVVSSSDTGGMSLVALEEVLEDLTVVTEEVIVQAEAADAEMNRLSDARESLIEQRMALGVPSCQPDPQSAIVDMRSTLAVNVAREYQEAAREFVAWWADVATLAVTAAVTGQHVHPARAAAADPTRWFDDEDLQHLPEVPQDVLALAGLAVRMAATPLGPGHTGTTTVEQATDYASSAGLRFDRDGEGQIVAVQDRTAEARRCRLWGDMWTVARVPALPLSNELAELLTMHGAPAATIAAVTEVTHAVEVAVVALLRAEELESGDNDDEPTATEEELESLWSQADQLTERLRQYARALTNALPNLRTLERPQ